MPLKLPAGISKKVGLPNYGSLGASCHVEVELEAGLWEHDLDALQRHVQNAYVACAQAVNDELARQAEARRRAAEAGQPPPALRETAAAGDVHPEGNGRQSTAPGDEGGGLEPASARQVDFLRVLAGQIRGLGQRRLDGFCQELSGTPLAGLSARNASRLIDLLKQVRGGAIELAELWTGEAP